ncbi:MAG: hypothetical protein HYW89_04810 [Candidatus Sungiibacteriota bacterium]|uniref:Uncharacterized protein n=1 Tax=Candidatus Sungiibacteriota bacterium TaxID=2750080 RepID=A0A7T5RJK1_9BACT|nr:MAG: hypothetical protein HYW89_04810 [Candidatus Sungbacteria bacterium]
MKPKKSKNNLLYIWSLAMLLALTPFASFGIEETKKEFAATVNELLDPNKWFELFKKNITIPISPNEQIEIPTPEEALKKSSPQLKEVSRGVKEETGIDLAKFIGWSAKVLKVFFQVIVDLLEQVSKALGE